MQAKKLDDIGQWIICLNFVIVGSAKRGSDCWRGAQAAHRGEVHCQGGFFYLIYLEGC